MKTLPHHLALVVALAAGEAAAFALGDLASAAPLAFGAFAAVALLGYGCSRRGWIYPATALLGLALAWHAEGLRRRIVEPVSSAPLEASLAVEGVRGDSFDTTLDGVALRVRVKGGHALPKVGETWRVAGWLERRDVRDYRRRTLWVTGTNTFARLERPAAALSPRRLLAGLRARLSESAGYGLAHAPLDADLDRAILLGERGNIPREERQTFVDAGTVHVFAISGLHVMVIAMTMVFLLMACFGFPYRWVVLPLAPLLVGYVLMIGSPMSAVRAATMALVYFSAPLFWRKSDALVAWSVTFLLFHAIDPLALHDIGSALSFTVMLGILLFLRWAKSLGWTRPALLGVSAAAWAAGVPITARVFGVVTPGGLLANLLVVPIASGAVLLGFVGSVTGLVWPWLGAHFNNAAALLVELMRGISWSVAQLPFSQFETDPWSGLECLAWYATIALALVLIRSVVLRRRAFLA